VSKVFEFYLTFAQNIINNYTQQKGEYLPLAVYLKNYFKKFPKAGSRDRKIISQLIFDYFRLGNSASPLSLREQICLGHFVCEHTNNPLSTYLNTIINHQLNHYQEAPLNEKLNILASLSIPFNKESIFPFTQELSNLNDPSAFILSFLQKPDTFIRVKSGKENEVCTELNKNAIAFEKISELKNCIRILQPANLTDLLTYSKGFFEVQDRSSQQVLTTITVKPDEFWWDACCASGGKSLLLLEKNKNIRLFATDVRPSIIENYRKRISKVGFGNHETQVADLTSPVNIPYTFNGIICDVPCSGSGTWARTPEQLKLYNTEQINHYAQKQRLILTHAANKLRKGGQFVYITCSIFKKENEDQTQFITEHLQLQLINHQLIEGAAYKADTLYVAHFIKE
jgi:16S rRNA (cytosine967-C5)-methyltransferase